MISINEAMMSLLNKCDIDYKSLQDTVLPLWLDKYIEVGIEKREDVNCYTYKNIKKFELFYQDYTGNYCCPVNNSFPLYWFVYQRFIVIFTKGAFSPFITTLLVLPDSNISEQIV